MQSTVPPLLLATLGFRAQGASGVDTPDAPIAVLASGFGGLAVCDAIAINWVALVGIGGFGLAVAGYFASPRRTVRIACTLAIGAAATAVFLAIEPRCLKGPYAMMDAQVWSIWLSDVREMQPLLTLVVKTPVTGLAVAAFGHQRDDHAQHAELDRQVR